VSTLGGAGDPASVGNRSIASDLVTLSTPELPFPAPAASTGGVDLVDPRCARSPLGTFAECPMCGGEMRPEHAHERCSSCGWRDSCCD
jgi:hypothetical protein